MAATLSKTEIIEDLKGVLELNTVEGDARLDLCLGMAVEDILDEFGGGIGYKSDPTVTITYEASTATSEAKLYAVLPNDVEYVRSFWLGNTEVEPLNLEDFNRMSKSGLTGASPFIGTVLIGEDGEYKINLFPISSAHDGSTATLLYNTTNTDVSVVPKRYKKLVLLATAKEYLLWDTLHDPAIHSKIAKEYEREKARLVAKGAWSGEMPTKTTNQKRWEDSFSTLNRSNSTDTRHL